MVIKPKDLMLQRNIRFYVSVFGTRISAGNGTLPMIIGL
jgi:hypothetical protein